MAVVTRRVVVCDVDRVEHDKVIRYTIVKESRRRTFDLCVEHAAPIEELLSMPEGPGQGRRARMKPVTMEQIEQLKKARSQPTKKATPTPGARKRR